MRIAVLMGGRSAERDVSLASGVGVVNGLASLGHEVLAIDTGRGFAVLTAEELKKIEGVKAQPPEPEELSVYHDDLTSFAAGVHLLRQVDVVFVILHGGAGEDGTIQALLELANVPYTGSGVLASALAMNKHLAKQVFIANGIPTPEFVVADEKESTDIAAIDKRIVSGFGYPVMVKPTSQGSSVGLSKVDDRAGLKQALALAFRYGRRALIEKFIEGREFTVSILGDQALPLVEIVPDGGLYDYEHKYIAGKAEKICPVDLPWPTQEMIMELGVRAFRALDCAGFGRVDCRYSHSGQAYCLEVNTLPGMTATSLVPKAAKQAGIEFPELLQRICEIAIADFKAKKRYAV